jgi:hypothetical protein
MDFEMELHVFSVGQELNSTILFRRIWSSDDQIKCNLNILYGK